MATTPEGLLVDHREDLHLRNDQVDALSSIDQQHHAANDSLQAELDQLDGDPKKKQARADRARELRAGLGANDRMALAAALRVLDPSQLEDARKVLGSAGVNVPDTPAEAGGSER